MVCARAGKLRLLCAMAAVLGVGAWAQTAMPEYALKAAYIYHFIQYTDWPETMKIDVLQVCVAADSPLLPALAALDRRQAQGRAIAVRTVTAPVELSCHVHILGAGTPNAAAGTLTIAEAQGAPRSDAMITLKLVDSRVVFSVNNTMARQNGLKISSKLLRLAQAVQ